MYFTTEFLIMVMNNISVNKEVATHNVLVVFIAI